MLEKEIFTQIKRFLKTVLGCFAWKISQAKLKRTNTLKASNFVAWKEDAGFFESE